MKRSNRPRILFALHEPVDALSLGDLPFRLRGARVMRIEGFDYDAAVRRGGLPGTGKTARGLRDAVIFRRPADARGRIFLSLLNGNLRSREAAIVLGRLDVERLRLERVVSAFRPDLVVVPEDFQILHGGLASRFFSQRGIPVVAVPPIYNEWIAARSLMGGGIADWTSRTGFLRHALGPSVNKLTWSPPGPVPRRSGGPGPRVSGPFVVAALQNDDGEEMFLSFLSDAFPRSPGAIAVVAKFHPSATAARRAFLRRRFPDIRFFSGGGFGAWIRRARAFVTISSSSALVAVREKLPVIFVNPEAFDIAVGPVLRFYRFPPPVRRPDSLRSAVDLLAGRSFRARHVRRQEPLRRAFSGQRRALAPGDLLALARRGHR